MTTLTTIINNAFRECGITQIGSTPDANESAEALTILINYINSLYFDEVSEFLTPYNVGSNGVVYGPGYDQIVTTTVKSGSRLVCNLSSPTTLYFPPTPREGDIIGIFDNSMNFATNPLTINGNGRLVLGGATAVLNTNSYNNLFFHDIFGSGWTNTPVLAVGTDSSPFQARYDDMLSIALAMRLAPRFGAVIAPETVQAFERLYKQFKRRFKFTKEESSEAGLVRLTSAFYRGIWNFPSFNQGR